MHKGKKTCEILRKVRQQVADANGIAYTPAVLRTRGSVQVRVRRVALHKSIQRTLLYVC